MSYSLVKDGVRYYNVGGMKNAWFGEKDACPTGWHVPTKAEWQTLIDHTTAAALKSTTGWDGGRNGTNESGFSAYPDGYYYTYGTKGIQGKGTSAYFWTSSTKYSDGTGDVYIMSINYYHGVEFVEEENSSYDYRPIRCILDK
ncbi:FISUMP domain-containing protein [Fibrobacter sp. UWT3]|uniref:FISUMP domain-containing protein n=1 Tax=Fibrobacter sp. UWT3 TaxID=1896225 RepID=UPI0020D071EE|nr:FISUMP domain-containing protein [Fibrobacter sp. UWT3]